ncbi:MAG: efflux RND transporter permease subunit [Planctomycetia bacterium]|nr:efflux RND transporter permease subunit [Planctomycetia bacterium]
MSLSDLSIRNPVFAIMLSAALVVFGWLGYQGLGISQFPEIDFPVVNINTFWEGASPESMDLDVTEIIEDAVFGVEAVDYVQSSSSEGVSAVTVNFRLGRDVDVALKDVQNAVQAAMHRLPSDIDPPVISKINFNRFPVIWLTVHGPRSSAEINRLVQDELKQHIESIKGCGGVFFGGMRRRSMRVWLDAPKLHSFGLDAVDVVQAMRREHVEKPAGAVESSKRELQVRVLSEARKTDDFAKLPLTTSSTGQVIQLGDLSVIEDGLDDRRSLARFNREPCVGIGVLRATGANVVEVCDEVKRKIPELRRKLPDDLSLSVSTDFSLFIKDDIAEVKETLLIGVLLTAVVTYCFLGSLGTTINVCLSIPISLIGTFMVIRYLGFTVNFMTLLGLSLSVGVVVDDAILVLENIYRLREQQKRAADREKERVNRMQAAWIGAREITFAASAATFSIAAIFIPVAFLEGAIGAFFYQFAITVTVAVLLSLLTSLTITPMLCSRFLDIREHSRAMPYRLPFAKAGLLLTLIYPIRFLYWVLDRCIIEPILIRPINWLMRGITSVYGWLISWALKLKWLVTIISLLIAGSAALFLIGVEIPLPAPLSSWLGKETLIMKPIGMELVPSEDQSRFVCTVICPVGSSIDYVDEMLKKAEDVLIQLRDPVGREILATMFAAVSIRPGQLISEGTIFCRLMPKDMRGMTQTQVINEVRKRLGGIVGMKAVVLDLSTQGFAATRGYPVNFAVQGPDWEKVIRFAERIRERMTDTTLINDVNTDYRPGMPELHIIPEREKAEQLGIPMQRLGFTINAAIGGLRVGRFTDDDHRYDVRIRFLETQRASPDQLKLVHLKTESGNLIPLSDVVTTEMKSTLPVINRYNRRRKIELSANMSPGVSQGEALGRCREIAEEVRLELELPSSYFIVPLGNAQVMQQTMKSLWWALILGFVVAYMILGVQFNSFVHPFTVLMAVPFGVTGALATLWYTGDTLNLMSMIGLVLLAGLVKKNSIVLVDFASQVRRGSACGHELDADSKPLENGELGVTDKMSAEEAMHQACVMRIRPILMTSLATIAGAVPMAYGLGAGAETRAPLALAIIGGIVLSTLVTLFYVPVLYVQLDHVGTWFRRQWNYDEEGKA